jgi:hypothetical protein
MTRGEEGHKHAFISTSQRRAVDLLLESLLEELYGNVFVIKKYYSSPLL